MSATEAIEATLARIGAADARANGFTAVFAERARREAAELDARRARGEPLGPLAGVPYAVKNLFDVAGVTTLAGSKINASLPPAGRDAFAVRRLRAAGAILVGALNMDEYAYGFVTENSHYGSTRNPHDPTRIAGGSSGGSGAAVGAGLVPIALGTDTNGSIRVPSSLCGVFGLKPTFGRLSRQGVFPLAWSFDHIGPLAASVRELALAYDALQGYDEEDPACARRAEEPVCAQLDAGIRDLKFAIASGGPYDELAPEAARAVRRVVECLGARERVEIPEARRARAATVLITSAEASTLHLPALRTRLRDFDPLMRDRLLAGALLPASWVLQAQRFRQWYRDAVLALFQNTDVIIAAATPFSAPLIGQQTVRLNGNERPVAAVLGDLTAPLSFIGVPVLTVPTQAPGELPLGVQIICAPWREALAFRVASHLEKAGFLR